MNEVICCFCGRSLPEREAAMLAAYPLPDRDETQQYFYCHRKCFVERLHKDVPVDPDLRED